MMLSLTETDARKATFESSLIAVGRALAAALDRLLAAIPDLAAGPQQLAEALGLDKGSASRLLKAVRSRDPVALAYLIPGPDPLRRAIRSAGRRGVPTELLRAAEAGVAQFESLIQSAGGRSTFDGIVGHMLPEARRQYEARTKQLLYRGMCQLRGFSVEVDFAILLVHPAGDGRHVDHVALTGSLGLRRLRPDAVVRLGVRHLGPHGPARITTLDNEPIECLSTGRLDEFCTAPPAKLDVSRVDETIFYTLADGGFGQHSATDLVMAQWSHAAAPLSSAPGVPRKNGVGTEVDKPTRLLHVDVLVCDGLYPRATPAINIIDTSFRGMANINDPLRSLDWLNLMESIETIPGSPLSGRTSYLPRYADLLTHVGRKTGWDIGRFRLYRLVMDYPIYGTQVGMGFERPSEPAAGRGSV